MPQNENNNSKVYSSIGEVAQMLGVSVSCVRYWSQAFSEIVKPHRSKKGDRYFTQRDLVSLRKIHYLVKECGLTIRGAKARLDSERFVPKQPKPVGRPPQDQSAQSPDTPPVAPPDNLAIKAELISRLSSVSAMLHEINKYL